MSQNTQWYGDWYGGSHCTHHPALFVLAYLALPFPEEKNLLIYLVCLATNMMPDILRTHKILYAKVNIIILVHIEHIQYIRIIFKLQNIIG